MVPRGFLVSYMQLDEMLARHETALDRLQAELVTADRQLAIRAAEVSNRDQTIDALRSQVDFRQQQKEELEAAIKVLNRSRKRARLWRPLAAGLAVTTGVLILTR